MKPESILSDGVGNVFMQWSGILAESLLSVWLKPAVGTRSCAGIRPAAAVVRRALDVALAITITVGNHWIQTSCSSDLGVELHDTQNLKVRQEKQKDKRVVKLMKRIRRIG